MAANNNNNIPQQNGTIPEELKSFEEFLGDWHHEQTRLLAELRAAQNEMTAPMVGDNNLDDNQADRDIDDLIARVLIHLEEYFEQKSRVTKRDVFTLFDPTWCSTFESAFFWITGFRPCILLQFVNDCITDLTPEQVEDMERLKRELRKDERDLDDRIAIMQETIAAPPLSEVLKSGRHQDQAVFGPMNEPLRRFKSALEDLVEDADSLRSATASRVVEILNPLQCLTFLISAIQLQRGMRNLRVQIRSMIRNREMEMAAQNDHHQE